MLTQCLCKQKALIGRLLLNLCKNASLAYLRLSVRDQVSEDHASHPNKKLGVIFVAAQKNKLRCLIKIRALCNRREARGSYNLCSTVIQSPSWFRISKPESIKYWWKRSTRLAASLMGALPVSHSEHESSSNKIGENLMTQHKSRLCKTRRNWAETRKPFKMLGLALLFHY